MIFNQKFQYTLDHGWLVGHLHLQYLYYYFISYCIIMGKLHESSPPEITNT